MKILVFSDTHGNLKYMEQAVNRFGKNTDLIVHCGDGTGGESSWLIDNIQTCAVVCVRGNCDFMSKFNEVEFIDICGKHIMITHGHLFNVKFGLERLFYKAEEEGADIVFFGHTHVCADETIGNVRMINPGSCGRWDPTCAVVEIDGKGNVLVNHINLK